MLLINRVAVPGSLPSISTLEDAILFGWSKGENYKVVRFQPGEARKTIAFLSFSKRYKQVIEPTHPCVIDLNEFPLRN